MLQCTDRAQPPGERRPSELRIGQEVSTDMAARKTRKSNRLRVGIIGNGGIGTVHARAYSKLPDVQIVALCDLIIERAQKLGEAHGVARLYTDYETMLAEEELDIVSVCVPNNVHAPIAIAAIRAGRHVLCEKPLSVNAAEGKRIQDALRAARTKFMVGMNNRFRADTQMLRRYIEDGALGEIYYAKAGWIRRNGIPGMGSWFTDRAQSGGGPLIDIGVHALDLALYLMGNPKPVAVFGATYARLAPQGKGMGGWGTPQKGGMFDVEDLAAAQIRLTNGATVVLEASWAQYCKEDRLYNELYGTKGGATLDPFRIYSDRYGEPIEILPACRQVDGHEAEIAAFVQCVQEDRTPLATIDQAMDVMKIVDGIYESARTGASVAIK